VDWMPRGRDRTEDPHQTTRATDGAVIKADSEDRDSTAAPHGRLPRTMLRVCVGTIAALRELNDRRILSSTESSS
jgi:hypothetical protein